jgi:hypothetical protein
MGQLLQVASFPTSIDRVLEATVEWRGDRNNKLGVQLKKDGVVYPPFDRVDLVYWSNLRANLTPGNYTIEVAFVSRTPYVSEPLPFTLTVSLTQ